MILPKYTSVQVFPGTNTRLGLYCAAFGMSRDEMLNWLMDRTAGEFQEQLEDMRFNSSKCSNCGKHYSIKLIGVTRYQMLSDKMHHIRHGNHCYAVELETGIPKRIPARK